MLFEGVKFLFILGNLLFFNGIIGIMSVFELFELKGKWILEGFVGLESNKLCGIRKCYM